MHRTCHISFSQNLSNTTIFHISDAIQNAMSCRWGLTLAIDSNALWQSSSRVINNGWRWIIMVIRGMRATSRWYLQVTHPPTRWSAWDYTCTVTMNLAFFVFVFVAVFVVVFVVVLYLLLYLQVTSPRNRWSAWDYTCTVTMNQVFFVFVFVFIFVFTSHPTWE